MATKIRFKFSDFVAYLKGHLDAIGVVIGATDEPIFRQLLAFHVYRPLLELIKAYTSPYYNVVNISFIFEVRDDE